MFGLYHILSGALCLAFRGISETSMKKRLAWILAASSLVSVFLFILGVTSSILTGQGVVMTIVSSLFAIGFVSSALRKEP